MKKIIFIIAMASMTACSTTQVVNNASSIKADDKSNIVFFGYDIILPDSRIKQINFKCRHVESNKVSNCFHVNIKPSQTNFKSALPYKVKFGTYIIEDLYYIFKIGEKHETRCFTNKKGQPDCTVDVIDIDKNIVVSTNFNKQFTVSKNQSPYVGHFIVHTDIGNDYIIGKDYTLNITRLEVIDNFEADIQSIRDPILQNAIRKHVHN